MNSGSRIHARDVYYSLKALGLGIDSYTREYITLCDEVVAVVLKREWMEKNSDVSEMELVRQVKWILNQFDEEFLRNRALKNEHLYRLMARLASTTNESFCKESSSCQKSYACHRLSGRIPNEPGDFEGPDRDAVTLRGDDFNMTGWLKRASLT